ncbi:MAG: BlaI/MecI/CopY family transcriptional regulator [Acidobacteria bacterium]|nr:BlaI/MecI/CopY family transcriptional regulator [Acidobacteriota bacterium]
MKLFLSKFNQDLKPIEVIMQELGPLERDVMEFVWRRYEHRRGTGCEVSVRDVFLAFNERLAYTTLMTTLDRLHKKGLLERRKDGRAFVYFPRISAQELERSVARGVIDTLLGRGKNGVEPVLACIVDAVSEHDRELLDDLDRLIREKRQTLEKKALREKE